MTTPADLSVSLARRVKLFTRLLGIGFACWQSGEALIAFRPDSGMSGLAYILSGIGMSLTIVSVILVAGAVFHARKAKAFDAFSDPLVTRAARTGLIALGGAMAIAAALIGLMQAPQSPLIDLVIAAPVLGFCLHFAAHFAPQPIKDDSV